MFDYALICARNSHKLAAYTGGKRDGQAADDSFAARVQRIDAGRERGAARHYVVHQHEPRGRSCARRGDECSRDVRVAIVAITLGLLLGVTRASEPQWVELAMSNARQLSCQQRRLVVAALGEPQRVEWHRHPHRPRFDTEQVDARNHERRELARELG